MSATNKKFGLELAKLLNARAMLEMDLVRAMKANGNGISRSYVSMIVHNERTPPPDTIELLCDALKVPRDERVVLHRAAAIDNGYRIGALRE